MLPVTDWIAPWACAITITQDPKASAAKLRRTPARRPCWYLVISISPAAVASLSARSNHLLRPTQFPQNDLRFRHLHHPTIVLPQVVTGLDLVKQVVHPYQRHRLPCALQAANHGHGVQRIRFQSSLRRLSSGAINAALADTWVESFLRALSVFVGQKDQWHRAGCRVGA